MIRKPIRKSTSVVLSIIAVAIVLGGYTWLSHKQHIQNPNDTTIPTWSQMYDGFMTAFEPHHRSGERWLLEDAKATGWRLAHGLFWGVSGAFLIGILMGCYRKVEALFSPILSAFDKVPPTAMLAVFFVLFGTGMEMYEAMIVFGILPPLARTIFLSVREVPDELVYKAYTLGASQVEVVWNVVVRQVMPKFIDAIRVQIGMAMILLIAAEMVVSDVGFGYRIRLQSRLLHMDVVYPYLLCLMLFGYMADSSLKMIQRKAYPWYGDGRNA